MVMPLITCLLLYRSHTPPSAHTCAHMLTQAHTCAHTEGASVQMH